MGLQTIGFLKVEGSEMVIRHWKLPHYYEKPQVPQQIVAFTEDSVYANLEKLRIKMNEIQGTMSQALEILKKTFTKKLAIQKQMNDWLQRQVETLENKLVTRTAKRAEDCDTAERKYQRDIHSKGRPET